TQSPRDRRAGALSGWSLPTLASWPLKRVNVVVVRLSSERTNQRCSIWVTFQPSISSPTRTRSILSGVPTLTSARASSASMTVPSKVTFGGAGGEGRVTTGAGGRGGGRRLGENSGRSRVTEKRSRESAARGLAAGETAVAGSAGSRSGALSRASRAPRIITTDPTIQPT